MGPEPIDIPSACWEMGRQGDRSALPVWTCGSANKFHDLRAFRRMCLLCVDCVYGVKQFSGVNTDYMKSWAVRDPRHLSDSDMPVNIPIHPRHRFLKGDWIKHNWTWLYAYMQFPVTLRVCVCVHVRGCICECVAVNFPYSATKTSQISEISEWMKLFAGDTISLWCDIHPVCKSLTM